MNKIAEDAKEFVYQSCFEKMCEPTEYEFNRPVIIPNERLTGPRYNPSNHNIEIKPTENELQAVFWLTPPMANYFHNLLSNGTYDKRHQDIRKDSDKVKLEEGVAYTVLERTVAKFAKEKPLKDEKKQKLLETPEKTIGSTLNPWSLGPLKLGIETGIAKYDYPTSIRGIIQGNTKKRYAFEGWKKVRTIPEESLKALLKDKNAHESLFGKTQKPLEIQRPLGKIGKTLMGGAEGAYCNAFTAGGVAAFKFASWLVGAEQKWNAPSVLDYSIPPASFLWVSSGIMQQNKIEIAEASSFYATKTAIDVGRAFNGEVGPLVLDLAALPFIAFSGIRAKKLRELNRKSL